jgi:hypothetical protein
MGIVQDIFPFGLWKRLIPNDYSKVSKGGLNSKGIENIPYIKIDFTGKYNEKKLVDAILGYMASRRWVFGTFQTHAKGPEHNHILSGFKRLSEYYKAYATVRVKIHGWRPSGDKDKPDEAYLRIWIGDENGNWNIKKDYQGTFQANAKSWGLRNFFDKYFLRREFDDNIVPLVIKDLYNVTSVIKQELGIDTISYYQQNIDKNEIIK